MDIAITLRGIEEIPDVLEEEIKGKIVKLTKYFENMQKAVVSISKQRGQFSVETTLYVAGRLIRSTGKGNIIDKALNDNMDKLGVQVKKYNDKLKEKKYKNPIKESSTELEASEEQSKVVKVKTFQVKPMDVEEAILQLELLDHDFFIFRDEETEEINVIYRRHDGNYGLIKPQ
ncbi:MAG: ribosome hibernation-promoting factor, HPF/YfiA family [Caldisericaceae bacterium]